MAVDWSGFKEVKNSNTVDWSGFKKVNNTVDWSGFKKVSQVPKMPEDYHHPVAVEAPKEHPTLFQSVKDGISHFVQLPSKMMEQALNEKPTEIGKDIIKGISRNANVVNSMGAKLFQPLANITMGVDNPITDYIKYSQNQAKKLDQESVNYKVENGKTTQEVSPFYEASMMATHPLNAIGGGAETLFGTVAKGMALGASFPVFDGVALDKMPTAKDVTASSLIIGGLSALTHTGGRPRVIEPKDQSNIKTIDMPVDVQKFLSETAPEKLSKDLGFEYNKKTNKLNTLDGREVFFDSEGQAFTKEPPKLNKNIQYKNDAPKSDLNLEEQMKVIAKHDKGGEKQAQLYKMQMEDWTNAENIRRTEQGLPLITVDDVARQNFIKYENKPTTTQDLPQNVKGLYNIDQNMIKVFESHDTSTLVHELGHRFLFTLDKKEASIAENVFGVKDGKWQKEHHEKFADAYAMYIAEGKAPEGLKGIFEKFKEYTKQILQSLKSNNGGKMPKLSTESKNFFNATLGDAKAREMLLEKYNLKQESKKGNGELYQMGDQQGLKPESNIDIARRKIQDKFIRVKKLIESKANIKTIKDDLNPYQAEELFHGRVQYKADKFEKNVVDPLITFIAKNKKTTDEVDAYLHARHAIERNKKMLEDNGVKNGSGMSDTEATQIIQKYANDKSMNAIAQKVYDMNRNRLKMIKKEGLESDQFITTLESTYDNYVPLKRIMESPSRKSTGRGYDIKGKEVKRARGSDKKVESPLMNSILATQETIIRAEKNKVGKAMVNFIEQFPDETLYSVNGVKHSPMYDKYGDVVGMNPNYKLDDNVFHVKIDGKVKEVTLHDEGLASAFKNLNAQQMSSVMQGVQKIVRFIASVNTQYNPEFVVSNFERDLQTAMINLPDEVKANRTKLMQDVFPAIKGIYKSTRDKKPNEWSKLFDEMKSEGGTTGWLEQYDVSDMKKNTEAMIKKYNGQYMPKDAFMDVLKYIDDINTAVENGVRLVSYKMAKDSGLSKKKSASIAKNLTVNFNRKGELGTFLNTTYMFFNASIQGSARMASALKNSKRARYLAGAIVASSASLAYWNMQTNKDAYNKLSDFEKDTNYIFMKPDGSYYKVKVPYGYNVFKSMGDVVMEASLGELNKNKILSRIIGVATNAFNPVGTAPTFTQMVTPTILRPTVDLQLNKNFFGGNIKPEDNPFQPSSTPDAYKYYKSVSPIAKSIAQKTNNLTGGNIHKSGAVDISPETLQYLFGYATGGLGKLISRTSTTAKSVINQKEVDMNKVPFLRNVYGTPRDKAEKNIIYNMYKRSGLESFNKTERDRFTRYVKEAIKKKEISLKDGVKLAKTFNNNQKIQDWSDKWNITSYNEVAKNKQVLRDAIKMRIPIAELKRVLKGDK